MDSTTHRALLRDTNRLRSLLSPSSTRSVLGSVQAYLLHRANDLEFDGGMTSPARQLAFLLGLLLTTPEPREPKPFAAWERAVELLERIFRSYGAPMWPTESELGNMNSEWRRIRQVAGQALLHYHNTGLMASTHQVATRTRDYVVPFDTTIRDVWGITATGALAICD